MKVLLLHNYYQQRGGEDTVFESERELLRKYGDTVEDLCFDNHWIQSPWDKLRAGVANIYHRSSAKKLSEKIDAFRPDVIHVHNFFPTASPAVFWVAARRNIPIVLTLHNFRLLCAKSKLYRDEEICVRCAKKTVPLDGIRFKCYRNSRTQTASLVMMSAVHKAVGTWKKRVDQYIVLTEFCKERFVDSSLGVADDQLSIKPNFCFDRGVGEEARTDSLLFVGRLTEDKGVRVLLRAFENLPYSLKIIGTGPLEEEARAAAAHNPRVEFLGFQGPDVLIEEMKRTKALIFPSVWYETFGMTVIEAYSTGTPVIASNHGAPAEIVHDGVTGLVFEVGSHEDLARKVETLMGDEEMRSRLGRGARQEYLERYTPDVNYKMLSEIYGKAIERARS